MNRLKDNKTPLMAVFVLSGLLLMIFANCRNGSHSPPDSFKVAAKTNIFLIVIDTLRADHLGCYGYHRNTSPHIDQLAKEGLLFKNAIAQSSWTRPATASILTGLYPKNHGAITRDDKLDGSITLLPEILKDNGYKTFAFVTNGNAGKAVGFNQGYDSFFTFAERTNKDIHVLSGSVNNVLIPFIDSLNHKRGNFLYVHYTDPHDPYVPAQKHYSVNNKTMFSPDFFKSKRFWSLDKDEQAITLREMINAYDDEIIINDKKVGELIDAIKRNGFYDNSIIIIASDHGEEFMEHGGLKHGNTLYDEQLRIPLIVKLPYRRSKVIDKQVRQVDLFPTLLGLLNLRYDGKSDGANIFDSTFKSASAYSDLNLDGSEIYSYRNPEKKLIMRKIAENKMEKDFRWFRDEAMYEVNQPQIRIDMQSFFKERDILISINSKPSRKIQLKSTKMYSLFLKFPKERKRLISIRSLVPCERPIDVKNSNDRRCLSFRLFSTSNIDISKNMTGLSKYEGEYYDLKKDPSETNNIYKKVSSSEDVVSQQHYLRQYMAMSVTNSQSTRIRQEDFEPEQLEALRSLGYL